MAYKTKTHVLQFAGLFTQYRPHDNFMTSGAKKVYSRDACHLAKVKVSLNLNITRVHSKQ